MKFTEAQLEQAIIKLLGNEGYPHVKGESISRDPNDVLIKEDLRFFLSKRYAKDNITSSEIDSIIQRLETLSVADLYEANKTVMKMVSDGLYLKRVDHTQKDLHIQLIDYNDLTAFKEPKPDDLETIGEGPMGLYNTKKGNICKIVNQLEIYGYEKRIPDAILYINGLPLVVFEFKSAIREKATIHDAYVQLTTRYRRDIPELFKYNAFCVISDGVNNRVGSFFADYEYFNAWRCTLCSPHPQPLSQREKGVNYHGNFKSAQLIKTAKELRQKQTPAEEIMWKLVRNRQLANLKFRRQHQIGPYIVDFFCDELKLIVELDGGVHSEQSQAKHDHKRDAYLKSLGLTVLRFENNVFLTEPESVLYQIVALQSSSTFGRGGGEGRHAEGIETLYTMIEGLFNQRTLRDVIRNFIYFPDTSRKEERLSVVIRSTMRPTSCMRASGETADLRERARAVHTSGLQAAVKATQCSFFHAS